jgi:hypothetical protein
MDTMDILMDSLRQVPVTGGYPLAAGGSSMPTASFQANADGWLVTVTTTTTRQARPLQSKGASSRQLCAKATLQTRAFVNSRAKVTANRNVNEQHCTMTRACSSQLL